MNKRRRTIKYPLRWTTCLLYLSLLFHFIINLYAKNTFFLSKRSLLGPRPLND